MKTLIIFFTLTTLSTTGFSAAFQSDLSCLGNLLTGLDVEPDCLKGVAKFTVPSKISGSHDLVKFQVDPDLSDVDLTAKQNDYLIVENFKALNQDIEHDYIIAFKNDSNLKFRTDSNGKAIALGEGIVLALQPPLALDAAGVYRKPPHNVTYVNGQLVLGISKHELGSGKVPHQTKISQYAVTCTKL